jgi:hypothetical protein
MLSNYSEAELQEIMNKTEKLFVSDIKQDAIKLFRNMINQLKIDKYPELFNKTILNEEKYDYTFHGMTFKGDDLKLYYRYRELNKFCYVIPLLNRYFDQFNGKYTFDIEYHCESLTNVGICDELKTIPFDQYDEWKLNYFIIKTIKN